ncbi:phytanoyl-CoA dioxygenase family protein [Streptomyces bobili]|uniref:phytanoyl-CoA dioxygenase family protein n=1 Tax=Streptomyces bobili TaxID=67280 RepID=UPI0036477D88
MIRRARRVGIAWLALTDAIVENGCLHFAPGSYELGLFHPQHLSYGNPRRRHAGRSAAVADRGFVTLSTSAPAPALRRRGCPPSGPRRGTVPVPRRVLRSVGYGYNWIRSARSLALTWASAYAPGPPKIHSH